MPRKSALARGSEKFSYARVLADELKTNPPQRKGQRTRLRLKAAAVKVLEQMGYREMRVSDICDAAGIGLASFYFHFDNKTTITKEVLIDFLDHQNRIYPRGEETAVFAAMRAANLHVMRAFSANAGLMRCLLQLGDEEPEFQEIWHQKSLAWLDSVGQRLAARSGLPESNRSKLLLQTHLLGNMVDQLLRDLFITRHPRIVALTEEVAPTLEQLAELVSVLWYRAVFAQDPPSADR